jgi:hypothetical protein
MVTWAIAIIPGDWHGFPQFFHVSPATLPSDRSRNASILLIPYLTISRDTVTDVVGKTLKDALTNRIYSVFEVRSLIKSNQVTAEPHPSVYGTSFDSVT